MLEFQKKYVFTLIGTEFNQLTLGINILELYVSALIIPQCVVFVDSSFQFYVELFLSFHIFLSLLHVQCFLL